jgi:hypothetical protein
MKFKNFPQRPKKVFYVRYYDEFGIGMQGTILGRDVKVLADNMSEALEIAEQKASKRVAVKVGAIREAIY